MWLHTGFPGFTQSSLGPKKISGPDKPRRHLIIFLANGTQLLLLGLPISCVSCLCVSVYGADHTDCVNSPVIKQAAVGIWSKGSFWHTGWTDCCWFAELDICPPFLVALITVLFIAYCGMGRLDEQVWITNAPDQGLEHHLFVQKRAWMSVWTRSVSGVFLGRNNVAELPSLFWLVLRPYELINI